MDKECDAREYFANYRIPVKELDPNRIPGYIRPETVEFKAIGSNKVIVVGEPRGMDINI